MSYTYTGYVEAAHDGERIEPDDLVELHVAMAAASEGRDGAAQAALDLFHRVFPATERHLPSARLTAQVRPADYWSGGRR